jgi:molybdopterin synthase catalytic subunit
VTVPSLRIQQEAFDAGAELNRFTAAAIGAGAVVTFTGIVRSDAADPLLALTIEHYPELAQKQIADVIAAACARFELLDAAVIHRFGPMRVGEPIMQVLTLAAHRRAAFEGAEFLMDYLKTDAPFWKREERASGTHWVEAKAADDMARERWAGADAKPGEGR